MSLTITAYSTALFSTWIFIEELGILFDAGDGVTSGLMQKSGKIKHVFISHADRDHITGLLQFNQLNAREGFPIIYYPKDAGSFPAMKNFQNKFDPHIQSINWTGLAHGDQVQLRKDLFVESIRNEHILIEEGVAKSLSYKVWETKQKLKPEFTHLSQLEVHEMIKNQGKEHVLEEVRRNIISYSGDTPVDDYSKWDGSEILIHEATFIDRDGISESDGRYNKHSHLEEVMKMISEIHVGQVILSHFSTRYENEEIISAVKKLKNHYKIVSPIKLILPGELCRDLMRTAETI